MQTDEEMDRLRQALNNEEERLRDEAKAQELPAEPQAHPDEDALNRVARDFVTPGTPACGLFGLVIGLAYLATQKHRRNAVEHAGMILRKCGYYIFLYFRIHKSSYSLNKISDILCPAGIIGNTLSSSSTQTSSR